jgi:hypothetical protein
MKVLVGKKLDPKQKKQKKEDDAGIKLFEFGGDSMIKESVLDNDEKTDPLEEPKIYLNIVYHDQVL